MPTPTTYGGLVDGIIGIVNLLIPALFSLLFVFFVWKMIQSWILGAGDPNSIAEGKKYAWTAIVVFVVGISAWGIVSMLRSTFFG